MKNSFHYCLVIFLGMICSQMAAQAPVFDDLVFEDDSITSTYKATGRKFIYIKSKKGTGGVNKVSGADSILNLKLPINDIVLVFTETNAGDINQRADNNRERWENLLTTYPDLFQFNTNYKNLCQCNAGGDAEAFKHAQGFYIYYTGGDPPKKEVVKEVVREEPKKEEVVHKEEKKTETKKEEKKEVVREEKHKEEKVVKEEKKKEEKAAKEEKKEEVVVKEEKVPETNPDETLNEEPAETTAKPTSRQKAKFTTPKRSKDRKACRPPFYENGDEDLVNYFVSAIEIGKKQKRKAKNWTATVTIILNFDGTVKKFMVTGPDEVFNKTVNGAVGAMNPWNPAVKGGVTVKSQVKFILKYDKSKKGMIPTEINITPRPGPKCLVCITDSELFTD